MSSAAVQFTQRTEFGAYIYNREHTVDVLITLTAAHWDDDASRPEVCLSAALDNSGSMSGRKIELVKSTMQFVVRQLCDRDKLGVVTYNTQVAEVSSLKSMTASEKRKGADKIQKVRAHGGTNLSGGLFKSIQQIKDSVPEGDHGNPGPMHAVLLLTDGRANAGISDPERLRTTLASALSVGPSIRVHTFGYGQTHNGELLKSLAEIGGGNYYYIGTDEDVPTSFADALGGLLSVVAQNAEIEIGRAQSDVTIEKIYTGLKMTERDDGITKIDTADLYSEERKDILVRVKIPELAGPKEREALLNIRFSYFDVRTAQTITTEAIVCVERPGMESTNRLADPDFEEQRLRVNTVFVLDEAMRLGSVKQHGAATNLIDAQIDAARSLGSEYAQSLLGDLCASRQAFTSAETFSTGSNAVLSMNKAHSLQRSGSMYRNKRQAWSVARATSEVTKEPPKTDLSVLQPPKDDASSDEQRKKKDSKK